MLKRLATVEYTIKLKQPPSGGCVLKPDSAYYLQDAGTAAFRRLCVETLVFVSDVNDFLTAAFRRLCVETTILEIEYHHSRDSRLQAAVC